LAPARLRRRAVVAPVGAAPPAELVVEADLPPRVDLVGVRVRVQVRVWVWVRVRVRVRARATRAWDSGPARSPPAGGRPGLRPRRAPAMHTRKRAYAPSIVGPARLGLEAAQCTVRAGAAACAIRHQRGPGPSPSISLSTSLSLGLSLGYSLSLSPTRPWSRVPTPEAGACFPMVQGTLPLRQGRAFQQE